MSKKDQHINLAHFRRVLESKNTKNFPIVRTEKSRKVQSISSISGVLISFFNVAKSHCPAFSNGCLATKHHKACKFATLCKLGR
uniref:Uncharacterized protein n=1 Tax=Romanomermis culicivorax TaxID=13658 RepID=A0A915L315_ROMCU